MNIIAVTACPTGIAHTYMAAEYLERTGAALGHTVKVETQGAMGIENRLTDSDVAGADALIIAADIPIQGRERFAALTRVVEVPVQLAIRDAAGIFSRLR